MAVTSVVPKETKPSRLESITWGNLTWTYVERPTRNEINELAKRYPCFHPLNLDDVLSQIQRPKLDEYEDHLFLVMHFPVFVKEARICIPSEVDIFVGEDFLVTVHCSGNLKPLTQLFEKCRDNAQTQQTYMSKGSGYLLYQVLDRLVDYCFPMLDKIGSNTESIEDTAISKPVPRTARDILLARRDIISFRRIIRPQMGVIETLERKEYSFLGNELAHYFGDIGDHLHKIWESLEDQREIVDALADTSNWLTSHRIQEVMRILTIFMAIILPIEVIASIEGSNLLPGSWLHNPVSFAVATSLQVIILLGMVLFLIRRRWI